MNSNQRSTSFKALFEIFKVSTKLGFTSFGGPTAHLGYFHGEYIQRKKWIDEKAYAELVALCQFLPGPASSQVGIGIGVIRGGILGGVISFLGFTMPSVIALIIFALLVQGLDVSDAGWIHGLKIVAVAVVAHAILGMAKNLTPDLSRKAIAIFAIAFVLLWPVAFAQVSVIVLAGVLGYFLFRQVNEENATSLTFPITKKLGAFCITLFFGLLIFLPILRELTSFRLVAMFDSFYRAGALVFGGGHVVLPLLEREFVPTGFISEEAFLAGYGATQAVPGPMFTFAAYIGAVMDGWLGGILATAAIFLPAFLLVFGALPFWNALRKNGKMKGAFMGMNAAVVGILISALYDPIFTSAIIKPLDFVLAVLLFSMLTYWKMAPWIIVITGIVGGMIISLI
ncbi:chromate efflux transporter [Lysinibacillus sp. SGAir0095]|uniref:chromate efflux transporter n=1 Tax=Lysinibacillus sp. SGAir0095 TaxID=2070463 RepID=UPI0010CD6C03|nr:chromate efflux transporter [Lysinibacillus sp. SGAir0095]QCR34573.1 ChrA protein [Lysinibacillus sp. SGAir0095]